MLTQSCTRPSREELLTRGLPLVRRVAFRLARRLPSSIDVGDLIGSGSEGLLKAVESYDPERYPRFEAYAEMRIRSSIYDELRSLDAMTRHGRRRMQEVAAAIRKLEAALGRPPEENEVAAALGMELEDYQRLCGELARGPALARIGAIEPDDVESGETDAASMLGDAELKRELALAIARLSSRMQQVLALYYQEECTQAEIGAILGVTESRVCQILGEAAARLRAMLEPGERTPRSHRQWREACPMASTLR